MNRADLHTLLAAAAAALLAAPALLAACKEEPPPPPITLEKPLVIDPSTAPPATAAQAPASAPDAAPDADEYGLLPPTQEQESLLQAGRQALQAEQPEAAIAAFQRLAQSQPMSGARLTGLLVLADLYIERGQLTDALNLLEPAVTQAPRVPELAFVLGRTYKLSGKLEKAILAFEESVRLNPLLMHAQVEIGGLYGQLGQGEKAAEAFLAYERQLYKYAALLEDPQAHPADKIKIAEAFSFLPDDRAAEALLKNINDPVPVVRFAIIQALGETGTRAMIPALEAARDRANSQDDPQTAQRLAVAIERIKQAPEEPRIDTDGAQDIGPSRVEPPSSAP